MESPFFQKLLIGKHLTDMFHWKWKNKRFCFLIYFFFKFHGLVARMMWRQCVYSYWTLYNTAISIRPHFSFKYFPFFLPFLPFFFFYYLFLHFWPIGIHTQHRVPWLISAPISIYRRTRSNAGVKALEEQKVFDEIRMWKSLVGWLQEAKQLLSWQFSRIASKYIYIYIGLRIFSYSHLI